MGGDVTMNQAPALVLDHHKHVHQSEGRGYGDEEIAGDDPLSLQAQEGRPAPITSRSTSRTPSKILVHGPGRHLNPELQQQLIGNPLLTPRRILIRNPTDQCLQLSGNRRSAGTGLEAPEQLPSRSVPTDQGLRTNDNQGIPPVKPS